MSWGKVTERIDRAIICGQGPSWRQVDLAQLGRVQSMGVGLVAVNGAIDSVPFADYWFTLDMSPENQRRVMEPASGVQYYAAVPPEWERRLRGLEHLTCLKRVVKEERRRGPFRLRVLYQIVGGISEDPGEIYTGNSAFGALGLVYLKGAR